MVNKVTLIGNIGQDPEVRRIESGAAVATIPVATNESYKDSAGNWQDRTEWHDIVLWRNLAERAERQLRKGMLVYIDGKLTHRTWQDKDGNPRKKTEVVANYLRILDRREHGNTRKSQGSETQQQAEQPNTTATPASTSQTGTSTQQTQDLPEDDLPF